MKFKIGDRVKVKVDSPSMFPGGWGSKVGDCGAVTAVYREWNAYAVLLDDDPNELECAYSKDEVEAES